MKKQSLAARALAGILFVGLVMGTVGCGIGNKDAKENSTDTSLEQYGGRDTIYAASYINLGISDYIYDVRASKDSVIFSSSVEDKANDASVEKMYGLDLSSSNVEPKELAWTIVNGNSDSDYSYVANSGFLSDGSIYVTLADSSISSDGASSDEKYYLVTLDKNGNETGRNEITESVSTADDGYAGLYYSTVTGNDTILMSSGSSTIFAFDREGTLLKTIEIDGINWIESLSACSDNEAIISYWGDEGNTVIEKVNVESGSHKAMKDMDGGDLFNIDTVMCGPEGEIYLKNTDGIYQYDQESGAVTEVLRWRDSDLVGSDVSDVFCDTEGEFLAIISESAGNDKYTNELAILRETPASQMPQKEIISLGVLMDDSNISGAVTRFNRKSDKYRVEIKTYYSDDSDYEEAIENFNSDVLAGTAPDIVQTEYLNVDSLASKGVFADLNDYIDKDPDVNREDFFASALNSCKTKDGLLYAIPSTFSIVTIFGREDEVGADKGWTVQEMAELATDNPDRSLFGNCDRASALSMFLYTNYTNFIDWDTGKCSFDSQDFIDMLKFVATFPEEVDEDSWDDYSGLEDGSTLLYQSTIYDLYEYELAQLLFGEDTAITAKGFPNVDGNGSCIMCNGAFSINALSDKKDAAWEFIKSLVSQEYYDSTYTYGLPTLISAFDEMAKEEMETETYIDENGEEQVVSNRSYGIGDSTYDIYPITQEQYEEVKEIIIGAGANINFDDKIYAIIDEEAAPFFEGSKTAEEAASIIQSRIQTYVDESR